MADNGNTRILTLASVTPAAAARLSPFANRMRPLLSGRRMGLADEAAWLVSEKGEGSASVTGITAIQTAQNLILGVVEDRNAVTGVFPVVANSQQELSIAWVDSGADLSAITVENLSLYIKAVPVNTRAMGFSTYTHLGFKPKAVLFFSFGSHAASGVTAGKCTPPLVQLAGATEATTGAHRYWRLRMDDDASDTLGIRIRDLQLRLASNGVQAATGGTATAAYGSAPGNAFDASTSTYWSVPDVSAGLSGYGVYWLKYDFGAGNTQAIVEYALLPGDGTTATGTSSRLVKTAGLEWSDDNAGWTALGATWVSPIWGTDVAATKVTETRVYSGVNQGVAFYAVSLSTSPHDAFQGTGLSSSGYLSAPASWGYFSRYISAFRAGGFESVSTTQADNENADVYALAFGGSAITHASQGQFIATHARPGSQAVSLGFQPGLVFFWTSISWINDAGLTEVGMSFGVVSPGAQYAVAFESTRLGALTTPRGIQVQGKGLLTDVRRGAVVSLLADGFRLDFDRVGEVYPVSTVNYMALSGRFTASLGHIPIPTVTGEQSVPALAQAMAALFLGGHNATRTVLDGFSVDTAAEFALGIASGLQATTPRSRYFRFRLYKGQATTDAQSYVQYTINALWVFDPRGNQLLATAISDITGTGTVNDATSTITSPDISSGVWDSSLVNGGTPNGTYPADGVGIQIDFGTAVEIGFFRMMMSPSALIPGASTLEMQDVDGSWRIVSDTRAVGQNGFDNSIYTACTHSFSLQAAGSFSAIRGGAGALGVGWVSHNRAVQVGSGDASNNYVKKVEAWADLTTGALNWTTASAGNRDLIVLALAPARPQTLGLDAISDTSVTQELELDSRLRPLLLDAVAESAIASGVDMVRVLQADTLGETATATGLALVLLLSPNSFFADSVPGVTGLTHVIALESLGDDAAIGGVNSLGSPGSELQLATVIDSSLVAELSFKTLLDVGVVATTATVAALSLQSELRLAGVFVADDLFGLALLPVVTPHDIDASSVTGITAIAATVGAGEVFWSPSVAGVSVIACLDVDALPPPVVVNPVYISPVQALRPSPLADVAAPSPVELWRSLTLGGIPLAAQPPSIALQVVMFLPGVEWASGVGDVTLTGPLTLASMPATATVNPLVLQRCITPMSLVGGAVGGLSLLPLLVLNSIGGTASITPISLAMALTPLSLLDEPQGTPLELVMNLTLTGVSTDDECAEIGFDTGTVIELDGVALFEIPASVSVLHMGRVVGLALMQRNEQRAVVQEQHAVLVKQRVCEIVLRKSCDHDTSSANIH